MADPDVMKGVQEYRARIMSDPEPGMDDTALWLAWAKRNPRPYADALMRDPRRKPCSRCGGTGREPSGRSCHRCSGRGV